MPSSAGISPFKRYLCNANDDTRLLAVVTPSQSLMATFADQFRIGADAVPSSVVFEASSAAQSATSPALLAGFGTAVPLEHCSVYWTGMAMARAAGADTLDAVASDASVISSATATIAIIATNAKAVAVLIAYLGICAIPRCLVGSSSRYSAKS